MNNPQIKKIVMVFKTHFDIGFTELAAEVVDNYSKKLLPDVLKTCRETKDLGEKHQFVWTMSAWPLVKALDKEKISNETYMEAENFIKSGQLTWHALPFTTHTEFCGLEDFIRGLEFSKELSQKYNKPLPISAKMTDVPGHTWILPSILHKAGIKFLHLGCNECAMPPNVPRLFYWEGPDGNRVLTFYNKGGYGSSVLPPKDWQFPVWLSLTQLGDNGGPQSADIVKKMIDKISKNQPDSDIVVGTLDDFYNALEPFFNDSIPVIKGDLADSWIHGVGTYPKEVSQIRSLRSEIKSIEKSISLKSIIEDVDKEKLKSTKNKIKKIYENLVLFGEHTWGLDVKTHLSWSRHYEKEEFLLDKKTENHLLMEKSWDDQRKYVRNAIDLIEEIKSEAYNFSGEKFSVFNPLAWERDEWINIDTVKAKIIGKTIVDDTTKSEVVVENTISGLKMKVLSLPAMGFKTFSLIEKTSKEEKLSEENDFELENNFYKIKVDPVRGCIASLFDKALSKEWVKENSNGIGQYQYDIYSRFDMSHYLRKYTYLFSGWWCDDAGKIKYPDIEHKTFTPNDFTIKKAATSNSKSLIIESTITDESVKEFGNAKKVITTITIYNDSNFIDIKLDLEAKEETPVTEAGHMVFPLNLKDYKIKINKLGCVVDPEKDIVEDANNLLYCCENWVDISDKDSGMSIITYDTPLFSVGKPAIYDYSGKYNQSNSTLYFNLFNNMWGTNFPQWIGGTFSFKYRLVPHNNMNKTQRIEKIAIESVNPSILADNISKYNSLIETNENIEIIALKSADMGDGYILRFREIYGENKKLELKFNIDMKKIFSCDLFENKLIQMVSEKNTISLYSKPYEIHSIYIEV